MHENEYWFTLDAKYNTLFNPSAVRYNLLT